MSVPAPSLSAQRGYHIHPGDCATWAGVCISTKLPVWRMVSDAHRALHFAIVPCEVMPLDRAGVVTGHTNIASPWRIWDKNDVARADFPSRVYEQAMNFRCACHAFFSFNLPGDTLAAPCLSGWKLRIKMGDEKHPFSM